MVLNCRVWLCMAVFGRVWPCMAVYGRDWPCMVFFDLVWFLYTCGLISPFFAVIDPNSFGLVYQNTASFINLR